MLLEIDEHNFEQAIFFDEKIFSFISFHELGENIFLVIKNKYYFIIFLQLKKISKSQNLKISKSQNLKISS